MSRKTREGGDDDAAGSSASSASDVASLWRVSDSTGTLQMTEVARGKLTKDMLDPSDVFILDAGGEVFVWIGKGASKDERAKGMDYGAKYLSEHGKPAWTPLTRLPQGGESVLFKSKFIRFDEEARTKFQDGEEDYVAKERKMELGVLLEKQRQAEEKMVDNGSGSITMWRIVNLKRVEIAKAEYGQFLVWRDLHHQVSVQEWQQGCGTRVLLLVNTHQCCFDCISFSFFFPPC